MQNCSGPACTTGCRAEILGVQIGRRAVRAGVNIGIGVQVLDVPGCVWRADVWRLFGVQIGLRCTTAGHVERPGVQTGLSCRESRRAYRFGVRNGSACKFGECVIGIDI